MTSPRSPPGPRIDLLRASDLLVPFAPQKRLRRAYLDSNGRLPRPAAVPPANRSRTRRQGSTRSGLDFVGMRRRIPPSAQQAGRPADQRDPIVAGRAADVVDDRIHVGPHCRRGRDWRRARARRVPPAGWEQGEPAASGSALQGLSSRGFRRQAVTELIHQEDVVARLREGLGPAGS